ncbi:MAG: hypothetical protein RIQ60_548 [Pseudomonadota bacterium]
MVERLRPAAARLRRHATRVLACFLFMQVAAQLGAWVFPQLPAGVCSVAAAPDDASWANGSSHDGRSRLDSHGLSCPLCSGPATPPPPELASRVPPPPVLTDARALRDTPAPVLRRAPGLVRARGPPLALAPWQPPA